MRGTYRLDIKLNGAHISNSPRTVTIAPAAAHHVTSIANGRGLSDCDPNTQDCYVPGAATVAGTAGEVARFTVQAKDAYGNNRLDEQPRSLFAVDAFQAQATPEEGVTVPGTVTYVGEGAYRVEYTPTVSGRYVVAVMMSTQLEVQTVRVSGAASGTFTLSHGGATSEPLAWDASAAAVEKALGKLSGVGTVSVASAADGAAAP